MTDPNPGYARGFTESSLSIPGQPDTFVEVVPLGVTSVSPNVVISGELPQHKGTPATFDDKGKVESAYKKYAASGSSEDAAAYVAAIKEDRHSSSSKSKKADDKPASKQVTVNLGGSGLSTVVTMAASPAPTSSKSTGRSSAQVASSLSKSDPRRKNVEAARSKGLI